MPSSYNGEFSKAILFEGEEPHRVRDTKQQTSITNVPLLGHPTRTHHSGIISRISIHHRDSFRIPTRVCCASSLSKTRTPIQNRNIRHTLRIRRNTSHHGSNQPCHARCRQPSWGCREQEQHQQIHYSRRHSPIVARIQLELRHDADTTQHTHLKHGGITISIYTQFGRGIHYHIYGNVLHSLLLGLAIRTTKAIHSVSE